MSTRQTSPGWRRTGIAAACAARLGTAVAVGPAVAGVATSLRGGLVSLSPASVGLFDHATAQNGTAGARLACLPVEW